MNRLFNFISNKKVTIIVAIIIAAVLYVSITHMDASEADATNASTKYYTCISVESGDSLWDIAQKSINNLNNDSSIVAGTNLVIPYYEVTDLN